MDEDAREALDYYQSRRFDDQRRFYRARSDEFQSAQHQAGVWSGVFLVVSALTAALGTADIGGQRRGWAIAAAAAAALSAAIASYAATYQFDTLARTYDRALDALGLLAPDRPGLDGKDGDIGQFVDHTEAILLGEVERWGKSAEAADHPTGAPRTGTPASPVVGGAPAPPSENADAPTSPARAAEGQ